MEHVRVEVPLLHVGSLSTSLHVFHCMETMSEASSWCIPWSIFGFPFWADKGPQNLRCLLICCLFSLTGTLTDVHGAGFSLERPGIRTSWRATKQQLPQRKKSTYLNKDVSAWGRPISRYRSIMILRKLWKWMNMPWYIAMVHWSTISFWKVMPILLVNGMLHGVYKTAPHGSEKKKLKPLLFEYSILW